MAEEAELPGTQKKWMEQTAYKHSWRGSRDRKIRGFKMKKWEKFLTWGLLTGSAAGMLLAWALWANLQGW